MSSFSPFCLDVKTSSSAADDVRGGTTSLQSGRSCSSVVVCPAGGARGACEEQLQRRLVREQLVADCHDNLVHDGDDEVEERRDDALDALEGEVRPETRPAVCRAVQMVRQERDVLGSLLLVLERRRRLQQVRKKAAEQLDGGEVLLGGEEAGLGDRRVEFGVELNRQPAGGRWLGGVAGSTLHVRSRTRQPFWLFSCICVCILLWLWFFARIPTVPSPLVRLILICL